jgi:RNA polymerase sigma factor (TIGR02999 family)
MWRVLIDRARDRRRQKRGGERWRVRIDLDALLVESPGDELLALDEALEALAREDPAGAELVRLRAFAGLTLGEATEVMSIGRRTADRYWANARAWLCDALRSCERIDLKSQIQDAKWMLIPIQQSLRIIES